MSKRANLHCKCGRHACRGAPLDERAVAHTGAMTGRLVRAGAREAAAAEAPGAVVGRAARVAAAAAAVGKAVPGAVQSSGNDVIT